MLNPGGFAFTIPGMPMWKERARVFYDSRIKRIRSATPPRTAAHEKLIRDCFALKYPDAKPLVGPLVMTLVFCIPFHRSATKKEKMMMGTQELLPVARPDLSNYEKLVEDALNGVAYKDDGQIVLKNSSKIFSPEPRTEVHVAVVAWQAMSLLGEPDRLKQSGA